MPAFYTVILYLAGIVGERVRSEQELTMTMARKHTQQALAAHDAQVAAADPGDDRAREPLAPLAAATSSPETAQLIALQHAAVTGQVSVMDAARLNAAAKGHDSGLLDRLAAHTAHTADAGVHSSRPSAQMLAGRADNDGRRRLHAGAGRDSVALGLPNAVRGGSLPR